jgi:hypothetical protein
MTNEEIDKLSDLYLAHEVSCAESQLITERIWRAHNAGFKAAQSRYEAKNAALEKRVEGLREALKKFTGIPTTIILEISMEKHYFADEALKQDDNRPDGQKEGRV